MGRSWRPSGPVMEIERIGAFVDVEERGREWAGRSRATEAGIVRGAEPMWDCRDEVDEMCRRAAVDVPEIRLAVVRSIDVDANGFMVRVYVVLLGVPALNVLEMVLHHVLPRCPPGRPTSCVFQPDI